VEIPWRDPFEIWDKSKEEIFQVIRSRKYTENTITLRRESREGKSSPSLVCTHLLLLRLSDCRIRWMRGASMFLLTWGQHFGYGILSA
jgi:hypothetical protein